MSTFLPLDLFLSLDFICMWTCQPFHGFLQAFRCCGGFFQPILLNPRSFVKAALLLGMHSLTLVSWLDGSKRTQLCCASHCEAVLSFRIKQFSRRRGREQRWGEREAERGEEDSVGYMSTETYASQVLIPVFLALAGVSTEIAAGADILTVISTMWRRELQPWHLFEPSLLFWAFSTFYLLYTLLRSITDSWKHAAAAVELSGSS